MRSAKAGKLAGKACREEAWLFGAALKACKVLIQAVVHRQRRIRIGRGQSVAEDEIDVDDVMDVRDVDDKGAWARAGLFTCQFQLLMLLIIGWLGGLANTTTALDDKKTKM